MAPLIIRNDAIAVGQRQQLSVDVATVIGQARREDERPAFPEGLGCQQQAIGRDEAWWLYDASPCSQALNA